MPWLDGRIVGSMTVPAALGQEVAAQHAGGVAVDPVTRAFTFDHKAEGMLGVKLLGRLFAGHQSSCLVSFRGYFWQGIAVLSAGLRPEMRVDTGFNANQQHTDDWHNVDWYQR